MTKPTTPIKKIKNFTESFLTDLNYIVFDYINMSTQQKEDYPIIDLFNKHRDNLSVYLKNQDLKNIEKDYQRLIEKYTKEFYQKEGVYVENVEQIVDTMFYNRVNLNKKDIDNYVESLEIYKEDKKIDNLYRNVFKEINQNSQSEIEEESFKNILNFAFKGLAKKDKAELLSSFNIFIEKYQQTDIGKKVIDIINDNYKKNAKENIEEGIKTWVTDMVSVINQNTPNSMMLSYENGSLTNKSQSGGMFDALYFINNKELTTIQKKKLDKLTTIEEVYDFEDKLDNVKQIQISTTNDKGVQIEKDSIWRHGYANKIMSTVLNKHWISKADEHFLSSFLNKDDKGIKENVNIKGAIITAFKETYPKNTDLHNSIKDLNNLEEAYNKIQTYLTGNTVKSIAEITGSKENTLNIEMLSKLEKWETEYDWKETGRLTSREKIFQPEMYFSVHYMHGLSKSRKYEENGEPLLIEGEKIKDHELLVLIQYSALLKQTYETTENEEVYNVDSDLISKEYEKNMNIRAYSSIKDVYFRNQELSNISVKEIDKYVLNNFLMSDNALDNAIFFDIKSRDNFSAIVNSLMKKENYEDYEINKEDFIKKLKEISDSKKKIFNTTITENVEDFLSQQQIINDKQQVINEQQAEIKRLEALLKEANKNSEVAVEANEVDSQNMIEQYQPKKDTHTNKNQRNAQKQAAKEERAHNRNNR